MDQTSIFREYLFMDDRRIMKASIQTAKHSNDRYEQFQQEKTIMAFVNELIPEEQKEKFTFPVSISPFDGSKPTLWKWTIDRERDVYLVLAKSGGGWHQGTPPEHHYVLCWNGKQIPFAAEEHLSANKAEGTVLTWKILRLEIPPELLAQKDEVMQLIQEALDARGRFCERKGLAAVIVQFNASSH